MKKKLSGLGILFMLILKHPPLQEFALFQKDCAVAVRGLSRKQIAMEYNIN